MKNKIAVKRAPLLESIVTLVLGGLFLFFLAGAIWGYINHSLFTLFSVVLSMTSIICVVAIQGSRRSSKSKAKALQDEPIKLPRPRPTTAPKRAS